MFARVFSRVQRATAARERRYGIAPKFPKNRAGETQFADNLLASGTVKDDKWYSTGSAKTEFLSNGVNCGYHIPTTTHSFL